MLCLLVSGEHYFLSAGPCSHYIIAVVKYGGVGRHALAIAETEPATLITFAKFLIAIPCVYLNAITYPKLAIIGMYLRIFTEKPFRIAAWTIFGVLVASAIANILVSIFECFPVAYLWDKTIANGHCGVNTSAFSKYSALPNIVTDVCLLILPMPAIWKLHATRSTKIGLTATLLTGSV